MANEILGTVRASAWADMFDCGLRYYYRNIRGISGPKSGAAHIGTAVHGGTSAYDAARCIGKDDVSTSEAVEIAINTLRNPEEEVRWDEPLNEAEKISALVTAKYCQQIGQYRRYKAVEIECQSLDIATRYGVLRVTGHTDRVRETADGEGISDVKTGARAVGADGRAVTTGHHIQTGIYRLMAEQELKRELPAPDEIIGLQTASKMRVGTALIKSTKEMLLGDGDGVPGLIEIAAHMHQTGIFPPNPKSILCGPKYCPAYSICKYHD